MFIKYFLVKQTMSWLEEAPEKSSRSLLIWMHKAPQQHWYISEIADGKPCLFICSGLQVQIASANLLGTNAIINVCKCQKLSSWMILYYLLFSALKWYSAVLFKIRLLLSTFNCTKFKSFLLFSVFWNGRQRSQPYSEKRSFTALSLYSIMKEKISKKYNYFRVQPLGMFKSLSLCQRTSLTKSTIYRMLVQFHLSSKAIKKEDRDTSSTSQEWSKSVCFIKKTFLLSFPLLNLFYKTT